MQRFGRGRLRRGNDEGGTSKNEFLNARRCLSTREESGASRREQNALVYMFSNSGASNGGFRACAFTVLSSTVSRIVLGTGSPQNPPTRVSAPRQGGLRNRC